MDVQISFNKIDIERINIFFFAWNLPKDVIIPKNSIIFQSEDLDKSTGLLFVNYQGIEQSWIKGLFGSDDEFSLEKKDYRILVKSLTSNKTSVTFMDEQSNPLTPVKVSELYPAFAEILSQNELDI